MPFLRFHPQNGTFLELSPSDFQTAIQKPKRRPTALHPNRQTNRAQDVLVITGDYTPFDIRVHITQRAAPGVENFPRTDRHGGMCPAKSCRPHRRRHSPGHPAPCVRITNATARHPLASSRACGRYHRGSLRTFAHTRIPSRVRAVLDGGLDLRFSEVLVLARVGGTRTNAKLRSLDFSPLAHTRMG